MVPGTILIPNTDKWRLKQHMFTFVASTWLEWSIILNWGLGGRILDLDPIGFCPLLGKYGPGVGTRNKNDTSYMYWFMSGLKPILTIFQLCRSSHITS